MKRKNFGSNDVISVYKFMKMCGLNCKVRSNIHVSHKIMLGKLSNRYQQFPDVIILPKSVPFKEISAEAVKTGRIVLVKDDCDNIVPYMRPKYHVNEFHDIENDIIRKKLEQEQLLEMSDYSYLDGERITPGYSNYVYKKQIQELKEEKERLLEIIRLSKEDDNYKISTKLVRVMVQDNKRRRY